MIVVVAVLHSFFVATCPKCDEPRCFSLYYSREHAVLHALLHAKYNTIA
jgi:hypothetical protein